MPPQPKKIIITTEASGEVLFLIAGAGTITINWGDGTESKIKTLSKYDLITFKSDENSMIQKKQQNPKRDFAVFLFSLP